MNIQQTNSKNKINQISSLESLAEYAIDALAEESPSYFHGYEKAFTKEIQNYGLELVQECRNGNLLELSDKAIEKLASVEDRIGNIMDALCVLETMHFKAGFQFGALMIIDLMH